VQEKPKILLVDDEERILRSLSMLLRTQYQIFATSDGNEALKILSREKIHVIISDQRMPIMTGTELLKQARDVAPDTIRILLTGYSDADAALDALNDGEIFRYINKPWGPKELRETIAQAASIADKLDALPDVPVLKMTAPSPSEAVTATASAVAPAAATPLVCMVLDRDESTYLVVKEILEPAHQVIWRQDVQSALTTLMTQSVAIMVTELSLGDEDLSAMIKTLKQEHPEMLTIILTNFKDTSRLIELINQAQVYRYLPKPVRRGLLTKSIESSIQRYKALNAQPERLQTQQVEITQDPVQSVENKKVSDFLTQLRAKLNRNLGLNA